MQNQVGKKRHLQLLGKLVSGTPVFHLEILWWPTTYERTIYLGSLTVEKSEEDGTMCPARNVWPANASWEFLS